MINIDNVLIANQDVHVICTILTVYAVSVLIEFPIPVKLGSQYDASQRVRKNRTNFYSSVWVQTGARRHASVGNGSEPASSELRIVTRHIVN